MLHSTNVPETDYLEYASGTTYAAGDHCIVTTSGVHKIYESLQNANTGHDPTLAASSTWWLDCGATNRWSPFDQVVGSQASQSESMTWVLEPGLIDSICIMQAEASEIQIVLANQAEDLITNGSGWTGATGVTPPTGWDLVGDPSGLTIDTGTIKITADAASEGISQTISVNTTHTTLQLLGKYRNTAGDIAQYSVYDVTNSAYIVAATDLASSTVESVLSCVFTVPAGCLSIRISLMAKSAGDIVWFDNISVAPTTYNSTTNMVSTINVVDAYTYFFEPIVWATSVTKLNLAASGLPPYSQASVTVIITNTGGTAKCGVIVVGLKLDIGSLSYGCKPGLQSFSTINEDETFGTWSVTQRSSRRTLEGQLIIKNTIIDYIINQMSAYDATLLVWVGHEDYDCLNLYGIYRSFQPTMSYPNYTVVDFEVRGVI